MKITPIDQVQKAGSASAVKPNNEQNAARFADILSKASQINVAQQIAPPPTLQPVLRPSALVSQSEVYRSTERVLDAMDDYQRLLGDQKANLRQIEPAVAQLKKEIASLGTMLQGTEEKHPVSQVARETMILANKEITRFEGGEYIGGDC